ncbi:MAG: TetR/AcrR family transcriptional regulator [Anaerosomatales bacterium]|nr:TetR/AcrR family transcriptional regulator [Anaerosomatales bacterium]MDT8434188.1 TetR/AcrR family transcriptional regulator [Anaerosomatales bacterium]
MTVTREHIADSFERHLEQYGFRKTSVEDIAKDLHISKKTIYVHYESKDDIFKSVIERRAAADKQRIAAELAGRASYSAKVEGLIRIVFDFTRDWWRRNRDSEFVQRYQVAEQAFLDAYTDLIRDYVHAGVVNGEFTARDDETTVRLVSGLILAGTRMLQEEIEADAEPAVVEAVDRLLAC